VLEPAHTPRPSPKELLNSIRPLIDDGSLHKRAILTRIEIVDQLPHTGVGKVDKRTIRSLHGSTAEATSKSTS
jgi:non-ribosomal peptide synthetase component E (peptide arylation enzyme)